MSEEERAEIAQMRARAEDGGAVPKEAAPHDWRKALLESVASEDSESEIPITVVLADEDFPWFEFRNKALSDDDREVLASARAEQLTSRLDDLRENLEELGAKDLVRYWIVPALSARVPARAVKAVTSWADVIDASREDNRKMNILQYRPGLEGRVGTRSQALDDAGYDGSQGHAYSQSYRVRAGVDRAGRKVIQTPVGN